MICLHRANLVRTLVLVAVCCAQDAHLYLDKLIPPVLLLLRDPESRVRYYALEALYNFTKVVRGHILVFFNEIFVSLCAVRCRLLCASSVARGIRVANPCTFSIFVMTRSYTPTLTLT